ncbi:MAG: hypothetical protein FJ087_05965 [Deltaproteobacteria bacterium]|nr:hypothetical protein [Deltaproteobacteria bacterium]
MRAVRKNLPVVVVLLAVAPSPGRAAAPVCFPLPPDWRVALEVRDGSALGLAEALACVAGLVPERAKGVSDRAVTAVAAPGPLAVALADAARAAGKSCIALKKAGDRLRVGPPAANVRCRPRARAASAQTAPAPVRAVLDAARKVATITTAPPAGPTRAVLDDPEAVAPLEPDRWAVKREVRDLALADPMAFVNEGAAFPNVLGFPAPGFFVAWVRGGGVLDRMGLRAGDLITGINGLPLATLSDAFLAYGALAAAERFVVSVARGFERRVLVFELR